MTTNGPQDTTRLANADLLAHASVESLVSFARDARIDMAEGDESACDAFTMAMRELEMRAVCETALSVFDVPTPPIPTA